MRARDAIVTWVRAGGAGEAISDEDVALIRRGRVPGYVRIVARCSARPSAPRLDVTAAVSLAASHGLRLGVLRLPPMTLEDDAA